MPRYEQRPSAKDQRFSQFQQMQAGDIAQQQADTGQQNAMLSQLAQLYGIQRQQQLMPEQLRELSLHNDAQASANDWANPMAELTYNHNSLQNDQQEFANSVAPAKFSIDSALAGANIEHTNADTQEQLFLNSPYIQQLRQRQMEVQPMLGLMGATAMTPNGIPPGVREEATRVAAPIAAATSAQESAAKKALGKAAVLKDARAQGGSYTPPQGVDLARMYGISPEELQQMMGNAQKVSGRVGDIGEVVQTNAGRQIRNNHLRAFTQLLPH